MSANTLFQRFSISIYTQVKFSFNKGIIYANYTISYRLYSIPYIELQWTSEGFDNRKGLFLYIYLRDILEGFISSWFGKSIHFCKDKTRITLISVKNSLAERENFLMMAQSPPGLVRGAMVFGEPRFLLNPLSLNCIKRIRNNWKQFKP